MNASNSPRFGIKIVHKNYSLNYNYSVEKCKYSLNIQPNNDDFY